MAHQSLYRRYRPRRFGEVRGQDHVVVALRNAVANATEGHAYLFSGPRGTGKTSTARILAKALNCENLQQGEPCCECTPCQDMEAGRSYDLFELDAASNNGVDAIRELIERAAVGSPGRTKVYILDEVHMLSPGASNALLKTLEEPPDHVRFVLATTDPQKVLPTIRSRTQHYEFQLLSADELERYVRWIISDADLDVDEESIAWAVRQGRGSARDTLSALDQVVAAGGVVSRSEPVEELFAAVVAHDAGAAVGAVADALAQGHDPRVLAKAFLDSLRDAFLLSLHVEVPHLVDADRAALQRWADDAGTPLLTRSMESIGAAMVDMRTAVDPRVPLEVALVRLASSGSDSFDALAARIEALEQAIASGGAGRGGVASPDRGAPAAPPAAAAVAEPASAPPAAAAPADQDDDEPATGGGGGPAQARAALAKLRQERAGAAPPTPPTPPTKQERAVPSTASAPPAVPPPAVPSPTVSPPAVPPSGAPAVPEPPSSEPASAEPASAEPASAEPASAEPPASAPEPAPEPPVSSAAPAPAESDDAAADAPAGASAEAPPSSDQPAPAAAPSPGEASVEAVRTALAEVVVPQLRGVAKALFTTGEIVSVDDSGAVFALAIGVPKDRAERARPDVEQLLEAHLGRPVPIRLVEHGDAEALDLRAAPSGAASGSNGSGEPAPAADDEDSTVIDVHALENADDVAQTSIDRLAKAFPGAVVVDQDEV